MKKIDKHKATAFRLLEGKHQNPHKAAYSKWLKGNGLDHINAPDRSALIFLATNWDELYPRIPSHLSSPQMIHSWFKAGCPEITGKPSADERLKTEGVTRDTPKPAFEPAWICGLLGPEAPRWLQDFNRLMEAKAKFLDMSIHEFDIKAEQKRFLKVRGLCVA